jgi:hypothetical protein
VFVIGDRCYTTYGSFSIRYTSGSSNLRETTAVLKALLYFRTLLQQHSIHCISVRTDNMVTVFNLQRQGASESLLYETRQIFSLLVKLNIRLMVTHVPGVENVTADALSRMDRVGDYQQKTEVYSKGIQTLQMQPRLDVFANCENTKCPEFLALPGKKAIGARALDSMRYSWQGEMVYAFPPVQIVSRVLRKILAEKLKNVVMVVPEWPSRPWWNLMELLAVRRTVLGEATSILEPGPSLAPNRAKMPPGRFIMVLLSSQQ